METTLPILREINSLFLFLEGEEEGAGGEEEVLVHDIGMHVKT